MAKLISLSRSGRLDTGKKVSTCDRHPTGSKEGNEIQKVEYQGNDEGTRLQAKMPALYGPHSDRPWVQILRALGHGDNRA